MISEKQGASLRFLVPPEDKYLTQYLGPLRHLLFWDFQPRRKIPVTVINREPANQSPYLDALRIAFEVVINAETVTLYRKLD